MSAVIRRLRGFTLAASLVVAASPLPAQHWVATMSGANEIPANPSTATGFADVLINGNFLTVEIMWQNLLGGTPGAAHIHCCVAPGSNVVVALGFPAFPATASGTYMHIFDLTDPSIYSAPFLNDFGGGTAAGAQAALIAGLNAGNAYANIHDMVYPGGEIRANLVATPRARVPGTHVDGPVVR